MTAYLRAANVKDGVLDLSDIKEMNFSSTERQVFGLERGDVLVTEGSGSLGSVGASAVWNGELLGPTCFQNTLLRLRPRGVTEPRFLAWWARQAYGSGAFASIATGANIYHLSAERVRSLPCWAPAPDTQRAIADFLDVETARIDALIAKKRRIIELLREAFTATLDNFVGADDAVDIPLTHLVDPRRQVMYGIVLPGPNVDRGVLLVKGGDVEAGLIPERLSRTTPEIEAPFARARLKAGDIVIAIRGGIGAVATVPHYLAGANITQDVARIAPATSVSGEWLYYALQSPVARARIQASVTGATIRGINIWDLKQVRIPTPSLASQRTKAAVIQVQASRHDALASGLVTQISLLNEHRQAMITAAVTGQMEVPNPS